MSAEGNAPFAWRAQGDGRLNITYEGRHIMTLKGAQASKAIARLASADAEQEQLVLAKLTGNFKRGNERNAAVVRTGKGRKG